MISDRDLYKVVDNMASQHLQQATTPHLDGYLKGIRDEFDRLNYELDETRRQRDEYKTKCMFGSNFIFLVVNSNICR
jgi:hypothetical protein